MEVVVAPVTSSDRRTMFVWGKIDCNFEFRIKLYRPEAMEERGTTSSVYDEQIRLFFSTTARSFPKRTSCCFILFIVLRFHSEDPFITAEDDAGAT